MSATATESVSTKFHAFSEIESLVKAFERAEIAREEWDHSSHLTVACWYLLCCPGDEAVIRMREGLLNYLEKRGIETTLESGYHETITLAWMCLVKHFLARTNLDCSLVELVNRLVSC